MKKSSCDLIYKLIIALGLEYLLFFSIESILPSLIVRVFNINIILVTMVGLIAILLVNRRNCSGEFLREIVKNNKNKEEEKIFLKKYFPLSLILFLGIVMAIVLHQVPLVLIFVYLVVVSVVANILWKNS